MSTTEAEQQQIIDARFNKLCAEEIMHLKPIVISDYFAGYLLDPHSSEIIMFDPLTEPYHYDRFLEKMTEEFCFELSSSEVGTDGNKLKVWRAYFWTWHPLQINFDNASKASDPDKKRAVVLAALKAKGLIG